jgi:cellulose synthase/poly-beta-1,6-N-acetylglucosamine synthase-like glycosyltransferase
LAQQNIKAAQLVVFLDVDSTLPTGGNLLERAVTEFEMDDKLGFLQFRIKATNSSFNSLTQAVAANQNLLKLRHISKGYGGYKIFEGHNAMWRKTVLDEIGVWTDYYRDDVIITEDILMSTHVYSKGYYGKPLNIETGEWVPSSLRALESMWMRWTYGHTQILFKYFKKIYPNQTSLSEKFEIAYHMLHHLVIVITFLIAYFLQLLVPGLLTNIFLGLFIIIPQLVSALTSFLISYNEHGKLSFFKLLWHTYAGFFLVDTFIMSTQIKSNIKFMLGIRQGWKVTEKGVESTVAWRSILQEKLFHIVFAFFSLTICAISWSTKYDMSISSIWNHVALLFISLNLLLCIAFFGKQGRKHFNRIDSVMDSN